MTPTLTGESCAVEHDLLALPVRLGSLGLADPTSESVHAFKASKCITAPLVALIVAQDLHQGGQRNDIQKEKNAMKKKRREQQEQQSVELAQEKGSSAWLTVLPVTEHGFFLNKGEFWDALCLRYG